jgi:hypothetical protein
MRLDRIMFLSLSRTSASEWNGEIAAEQTRHAYASRRRSRNSGAATAA